jgi:hypothetical protein
MIESHYIWCFDHGEQEYIKRALDRKDVCHVVIYNRYYRRISRNKQEVEPYYFVAAAASFVISDTCSVLMYMGVSNDLFLPKSDYSIGELDGKNKKQPQLPYQRHDLGSYMLSIVQKMTYCATGYHTVIAQVKNHLEKGAIYFYLKMYFQIIHKHYYQICECESKFDNIFQDSPGLVYMKSRCPLYIIDPNFMDDIINIELMKDAIMHGAKTILNIDLGINDLKKPPSISNSLKNCLTFLKNEDHAFICNFSEDETESLSLRKEPRIINGKQDTVIFPNTVFWERFLVSNNLVFLPSFDDEKIKNTNHNYKLMALILFQDEQRFADMRCFFLLPDELYRKYVYGKFLDI